MYHSVSILKTPELYSVNFKRVNFMVYKLYLKVIFKKKEGVVTQGNKDKKTGLDFPPAKRSYFQEKSRQLIQG